MTEQLQTDEYLVDGEVCRKTHLSAVEKIESILARVNGDLSLKEKRDIFVMELLPQLASLSPTDIDIVAPEIERCFSIRRASILKEVKEFRESIQPQVEKKSQGYYDKGRERRAQSLIDGRLCYHTNLGWCIAGQPAVEEDKLKKPNPIYHFSIKGHLRLLNIHDGIEPSPKLADVLTEAESILVRHLVWKKPYYAKAVALWITGTYFASVFQWYPYLWITSPARRCGKSLLLEIISYLAFNATATLVNPRPAYLYRTVSKDFPTVIIDELTKFKGASENDYAEVLSLLNAGAKNGSAVARMEKRGESFEAIYYEAYSPKALAGLTSLPDTLADRVLWIDMARKKKSERVERLNFRKCGEELARLRDDLYLMALQYDQVISEFYDRADELDIPEELDDRLRDVSEPLFVLASIVDTEKGNLDVTSALKICALELAGARSADDHADLAQHTVKVLLKLNLQPGDTKVLTGREAKELFREEPELEWCDTPQKAGRLLNRLGFNSHPYKIGMKLVRGYKLNYEDIAELRERYLEEGKGTQ